MVADHPIALAVDRTGAYLWRQTGEVGHGLVDQENARLDEQDLLAQSSQTMGISHGSVRLRTAAHAIYKIQSQCLHSSSNQKAREGWRTPHGLPTGVMRVGLGPNCPPMMTSRH